MEEDEDEVGHRHQDQLGPVEWEEEEEEGVRATKRRRRSLGDESLGLEVEVEVGEELRGTGVNSQQEERIHRSLRQLEIDLGKVKELIKVGDNNKTIL